jgi:hypothetical protein
MVEDADPDPGNELQILFMSNDTIFLTDGGFVKLPVDISDDGDWVKSGDYLYVGTDSIGIGTDEPKDALDVRGGVLIGPSWTNLDHAPYGGLAVWGSVGIGTASPVGIMDIEYGGTAFVDVLRVSKLDYNDQGTGIVVQSNTSPSSNYNFMEAISDFSGTPITQFIFRGDGFLGMGVTNPQCPLHINQKQQFEGIRLEYDDSNYWETFTDLAQDYNFAYNSTLISYIDDSDGSYNIVSDKNLKTDIIPLNNVIGKVNQLQPSFYRLTTSNSSKKLSIGLIAQEVEPLFPETVNEKEGIKAINYDAFAVIAIQAIKEQQEIIEDLKSRLEELENR